MCNPRPSIYIFTIASEKSALTYYSKYTKQYRENNCTKYVSARVYFSYRNKQEIRQILCKKICWILEYFRFDNWVNVELVRWSITRNNSKTSKTRHFPHFFQSYSCSFAWVNSQDIAMVHIINIQYSSIHIYLYKCILHNEYTIINPIKITSMKTALLVI